VKAIAKHVRISPKKANLIAGLVRNKKGNEALAMLKFTPKKGAKVLYKVLHSAIANAEANFKQNRENLIVKEIVVTKGPTLKRSVPVSRGRVHPILKRTSHITVTVGIEEKAEGEKKAVKKEKKPAMEAKTETKKTEKADKKTTKSKK